VVVSDSCEFCGVEKVLFPPVRELRAPPFVIFVPAFDCPPSEYIVSGFVATVPAADLVLNTRTPRVLLVSS
jgi:hypothetical protein